MSSKNLISRITFSFVLVAILFAFSAPTAAQAKSPALTSMAHAYGGTYRIGRTHGTVSFAISRMIYGGMWEGTAVLNGIQYYSNGIPQTNGTMIVNIFSLDANYNQVQVATFVGTFSADFVSLNGPFTYKNRTGTANTKAQ